MWKRFFFFKPIDDTVIMSASEDGRVRLYDLRAGEETIAVRNQGNSIIQIPSSIFIGVFLMLGIHWRYLLSNRLHLLKAKCVACIHNDG